MAFRWIVKDAGGAHIDESEPFPSKDEAEAWMGDNWRGLVDRGGHSVTLMQDDSLLYDMGLHEA